MAIWIMGNLAREDAELIVEFWREVEVDKIADEPAEFAALTEIQVYGTDIKGK